MSAAVQTPTQTLVAEFLDALDPSSTATFNIEHYTDHPKGAAKPKSDPLIGRHADLTRVKVLDLVPTLEAINSNGAGIFVAVNQCNGNRSKSNIARIRGVHADLDDITAEQYQVIAARLLPTVQVQSSAPDRIQTYWLLADGEVLALPTAEGINRQLVTFGADKAAVDASRLLRVPGFRHMKYRNEGRCPMVTLVKQGPRYTAEQLLSAFGTDEVKQAQQPQPRPEPEVLREQDQNTLDPRLSAIQSVIQRRHPALWSGDWANPGASRTGAPYESQSQADLALAGHIARECARTGIDKSRLQECTESIFSNSGLGTRDKWLDRHDYRDTTISKACEGVEERISDASSNTRNQSDVALESYGDIRNAKAFANHAQGKLIYITSRNRWLIWK
jgi:hypothetical protein